MAASKGVPTFLTQQKTNSKLHLIYEFWDASEVMVHLNVRALEPPLLPADTITNDFKLYYICRSILYAIT